MKTLIRILLVISLIVASPFIVVLIMWFVAGIAGIPWFLSSVKTSEYWRQTPAYIQMPTGTYKLNPELGPSIYRRNEEWDSAFVRHSDSQKENSFRVFKGITEFTIQCHKGFNCLPNLNRNQGIVTGTVYFDEEAVLNPDHRNKELESFDDNFDFAKVPLKNYPVGKIEFSLISKEPLYFDSFVAVSCAADNRRPSLNSRICYFETLKRETDKTAIGATVPGLRLLLSDLRGSEENSAESNVYHPELWPEIIKGFEEIIRESQMSSLEVGKIEVKAEGHWQADRRSPDYKD